MRWILLFLCGWVAAACTPTTANIAPTFDPFPTMTPGRQVVGALPTSAFNAQAALLANPATAVAIGSRPTPTPNRAACPALLGNVTLARRPATLDEAKGAILRFLQEGGSVTALREGIRVRWQMFGQEGYALDTVDLTGEGAPEIILGWSAPGREGVLHVIGCRDGLYEFLYEAFSGGQEPPRLLKAEDLNNAPPAELAFANVTCDARDNCEFVTNVLAWDGFSGRFRSLLAVPLNTLQQPEFRDVDSDLVLEIVINMQSNGNSVTGPLRRGVHIYDWNGSSYVLSIVQLEPPRYYIQIAHEGDRQFSQLRMAEAAATFQLLADAEGLRYWFNDEAEWLRSYALYRLLLAYAYLDDPRQGDVFAEIVTAFPFVDGSTDGLPVYAQMAYRFLEAVQRGEGLHQACLDVLELVGERREALTRLNRYGTRSPVYATLDLCPF